MSSTVGDTGTTGAAQLGGTTFEVVPKDFSARKHELLLQKAIALQLSKMGIPLSRLALDDLLGLAQEYMDVLLADLAAIARIQRRRGPSPDDLGLLMRGYGLSPDEIEYESVRHGKHARVPETTVSDDSGEQVRDTSLMFQQDDDLLKLLPQLHQRSKAIPSWLPQFPPEHTYRHTPNYVSRVTSEKLVREKIVQESKFGEIALEKLVSIKAEEDVDVEDDDSEKEESLEDKLEGESPSPVETKRDPQGVAGDLDNPQSVDKHPDMTGDEQGVARDPDMTGDPQGVPEIQKEASVANEKRFDVEKYARKRIEMQQKKQEQEKLAHSKINHEYLNLVKKWSCFCTDGGPESAATASPEEYIENQFRKTLKSIKSVQQKRAKREIAKHKLLELKRQKQEELKKQKEAELSSFENFESFDNFDNFDSFQTGFDKLDDDSSPVDLEAIAFGGVEGSEPTQAPSGSAEAPIEPLIAPSGPVEAPNEPVEAPNEPAEAPNEPVEAPNEPVEAPNEPAEPAEMIAVLISPTEPLQPEIPAPGAAPVEAPQQEKPDQQTALDDEEDDFEDVEMEEVKFD